MFIMEASTESSSSSFPPNFAKVDIREIKEDFMVLQAQVEAIDIEGGRRLENVDKYLVHLKKENKMSDEEVPECCNRFDCRTRNKSGQAHPESRQDGSSSHARFLDLSRCEYQLSFGYGSTPLL